MDHSSPGKEYRRDFFISYVGTRFIVETVFQHLSMDVVRIILTYAGLLSYHNGKYMNRIDHTDPRYRLLQTIPRPIRYLNPQYDLIPPHDLFEIRIHFSSGNHMIVTDRNQHLDMEGIRYIYYWYRCDWSKQMDPLYKDEGMYGHGVYFRM